MSLKNRILLQRIGYTLAGLAAISVAGGWRAGLAAVGATLILRRMLMTLGSHLASFALAHFRPEQLQPESLPPARPVVRERVERPRKVERPAKPREEPPAAPPQPPEEKKRRGLESDLLRDVTFEVVNLAHCPCCPLAHAVLELRPEPLMERGSTDLAICPKTFDQFLIQRRPGPAAKYWRAWQGEANGWKPMTWRPHDPEGRHLVRDQLLTKLLEEPPPPDERPVDFDAPLDGPPKA